MTTIPIYIRRSVVNQFLEKAGDLAQESNLIFNDEGGGIRAHVSTACKFATLTAASPLISLARAVRSAVFLVEFGDARRACSEFLGAFVQPFVAGYCLAGSFASFSAYLISGGKISFYVSLRRTYAYFEAWVNNIDLQQAKSYSQRVSAPADFTRRIWTTAPCMQPILERGLSRQNGCSMQKG